MVCLLLHISYLPPIRYFSRSISYQLQPMQFFLHTRFSFARSFASLYRLALVPVFTAMLLVISTAWTPSAQALPSFDIVDLTQSDCPDTAEYESQVTPWGGPNMDAKCVMIHGKAQNDTGKPILNADIFGRMYDADGNSIMENRTRLGGIDEVPPGVSEFDLRVSVAADQPLPLQLEQFRGSGFTGKVRRY